MSPRRVTRAQVALVLLLLVVLQFYIRPRLWNARVSPDFLLIGLMLFAMRSGAGAGALAGFLVGLIEDTLTPARFGAAALAHTVVGYLASWGRAWLRDLIVLVASETDHRQLLTELTFYSPIQALTTAAFALALLLTFRAVFSVRLDA
jgi:rod shape-determining protein MreD